MATSTTNLGLIKPAGTDKIRIAQINQNMDTLDAAVGAVGATSLQAQVNALGDGLAIVANGDSHIAISAGQYVYVKNNTHSLNEGLYVASAAVSANGAITSSNMTADDDGGLNALNAKSMESLGYSSGKGYVSFKNGWMIQWGQATIPIGSDRVQVDFPYSYNYHIPVVTISPFENSNASGTLSDLRVFDTQYGKFWVYNKSGNVTGHDIIVNWMAMGTWTNI